MNISDNPSYFYITGEFPQKVQWRGTSMFPLIFAWIDGWVKIVRLVICNAIALIMTSLECYARDVFAGWITYTKFEQLQVENGFDKSCKTFNNLCDIINRNEFPSRYLVGNSVHNENACAQMLSQRSFVNKTHFLFVYHIYIYVCVCVCWPTKDGLLCSMR